MTENDLRDEPATDPTAGDVTPEIAADDAGASAMAERASKIEAQAGETPASSTPAQSYTPVEQRDSAADPADREAMDREGAELAMQSDHHAFAGSAQGIGSVAFDDPGAYDVTRPNARPERRLNSDPAAIPHSESHPDAETRRIRAGGLAPGDDGAGGRNPGAAMAEDRAFERPARPQDAEDQIRDP